MKHLPHFPSILAIYCFCLLQVPSSGFPRPSADSPDGLDIMQLEDKQDIYKRFLFHYSRTQELTHSVKIGCPPVHPSMRLAAKLAHGKMKRFLPRDSGAAAVDFTKKDHTATWGRPFFLFRPRNGRNTEENTQ